MDLHRGGPSLGALGALRDALASAAIDVGGDEARGLRDRLLAELEGHLIPRVAHPHAPVIVALTGPTGSGKSTLVNALAQSAVTPAGALRPTTRAPVLVHRAEDVRWFPGERRRMPAWGSVHGVVSPHLPPGVALLDTPDLASARHGVRRQTEQLLSAADIWLVVTTATRYADAIPWQALRSAGGRECDLALVLNRTLPDAVLPIRTDLERLLEHHGLGGATLMVVPETPLTAARLPTGVVAPVRQWIEGLSSGGPKRAEVMRRVVAGAVAALADPVAELDRLAGGDRRLRTAVAAVGGVQ